MTETPTSTPAAPTDDVDIAAVHDTIADYYLGWYDADPERMARALHRRLAKRAWIRSASGQLQCSEDTFESMVDATGRARGRRSAPDERRYDVRAVEIHQDIASACVYAVPYVDYLHLVRTPDGWRIMNALWCKR